MSRGAFFLALLLIIMGLTFLVAALRGHGPQMIAALKQVGTPTAKNSKGVKNSQTKTR